MDSTEPRQSRWTREDEAARKAVILRKRRRFKLQQDTLRIEIEHIDMVRSYLSVMDYMRSPRNHLNSLKHICESKIRQACECDHRKFEKLNLPDEVIRSILFKP